MKSIKTEDELFSAAILRPASERNAFILRECGTDEQLLARLRLLLQAHEQPADHIEEVLEKQRPTLTLRFDDGMEAEKVGQKIGRYKLLEKIGEGGCGTVYVAEQTEPVIRRVALKVIKLGMDTKAVVARFEAERQALAMMDHPNIAKVLDAGATITGRPFFVMELVRGIKITDYCHQNCLTPQARLNLFIQVCRAIQHAHQKGIIHRDIKPSNVLVTLHDGTPVPKVIDFGIAKATQGRLTDQTVYTAFEQFIGTPAYMSPEQAEMSGLDIDTRSDIYSLGVLLYELLTGKTPFDAKKLLAAGLDQIRRTIREVEPVKPSTRITQDLSAADVKTVPSDSDKQNKISRQFLQEVRGDLDSIVMKCLEKDRQRRYETANGLAMDLIRHLNNEPVQARPPSAAYKFRKAFRRNRLLISTATVTAISLIIGVTISTWLFVKERRSYEAARTAEAEQKKLREVAVAALDGEKQQRLEAERARAGETRSRSEAEARAYASDMNLAKLALDQNNLGRAFDLLEKQRPRQGQRDLRGWEWRYLWRQIRSDALFTLGQEATEINSLAVSFDGQFLAVAVLGRGGVSLWDLKQRKEVMRLAPMDNRLRVAFSPTESLLAFSGWAAGDKGSFLHLWNGATRQVIAERKLDGECAGLAISADGSTLVTSTSGGHITLWRLPDAIQIATYSSEQSSGVGTAFAVTPDLSLAAYASPAKQIRVVNLRSGQERSIETASKGDLNALALSPNGTILASSGGFEEPEIHLWDVRTGHEIGQLEGHHSWVSSIVFWPDGKKLASSSADQTIRVWDLASRKCLDAMRGHRQEVWRLALVPNRETLVSGCKNGEVCFWDSSVTHSRESRIQFPDDLLTWRFASDSQSVLTFNVEGRVTRWGGLDFREPHTLAEIGDMRKAATTFSCLSPDGRRLATGSTNGILQVWDIPNRSVWRQWTNTAGSVSACMFLSDASRLLSHSEADNAFHEWDLEKTSEIQSWKMLPDLKAGGLSPDERCFITIGYGGDVELRNLLEGNSSKLGLEIRECSDFNFLPNGRLAAASSYLGFVRVWDTSSWREVVTLNGFFNAATATAFSFDGARLAVAGAGKDALKMWDTENWLETVTLDGDGSAPGSMAFSADGNCIGSFTPTDKLQIWRAPSWEEINAAETEKRALPKIK